MTTKLNIITSYPEKLLKIAAEDILSVFTESTLLKLSGKSSTPLFVSVLLHGNEHTGFYAIQRILQDYQNKELPHPLFVFFGNVKATAQNERHLDDQPDFNRIWDNDPSPEGQMISELQDMMKKENLMASIDVHNNSGKNPHYGCISVLNEETLRLAKEFSDTVISYAIPSTTQSIAFSKFTNAITIECGLSQNMSNIEHVYHYISKIIEKDSLEPLSQEEKSEINLYETYARIRIPDDVSFAFHGDPDEHNVDIVLRNDLDSLNFKELPPQTVFGHVHNVGQSEIMLEDHDESTSSHHMLSYLDDGCIVTSDGFIPAMLTMDKKIIRLDCVGYLMKERNL